MATMRAAAILLLMFGTGCAALQSAPPPPEPVEDDEDLEEKGVGEISAMLRDSNRNLAGKEFDEAMRLLRRAERSLEKADTVTQSHPDFEDLERAVQRARRRLEEAIENDRIAKRNAAIDDLIRRGTAKLNQGGTLYNELKARIPNEEDVDIFREIVDALTQLKTDGRKFTDDPRYAEHAKHRDVRIAALARRARQAKWQFKANAAIQNPIRTAVSAAKALRAADSDLARVSALRSTADAYSACVNVFADLSDDEAYREDWLVESALGTKAIGDTRSICLQRGNRARSDADNLEWRATLEQVTESTSVAMRAVRKAKRADDALEKTDAAIETLAHCNKRLLAIQSLPGHDAGHMMKTVFGRLTPGKLAQTCAAEGDRLIDARPRLEWRTELDALGESLEQLKAKIREAAIAKAPSDRMTRWRANATALKRCAEEAENLGSKRSADAGYTARTAYGKQSVQGLQKQCSKLLDDAEKQLGFATADHEKEKFIETCRGDEAAVARREGIPDRIEAVPDGRVFVYEKKASGRRKAATKEYGFDRAGKSVDFGAKWLDTMSALLSELERVTVAIRDATNGKQALVAAEGALPVLEICAETVNNTRKNPGFDPRVNFKTVFGKMQVTKLEKICAAEREKRAKQIPGIRWRIELEALRDGAVSADADLAKAEASKSSADKATSFGAAVAGYEGCSTAAEKLARQPNADKNLKVRMKRGKMNLRSITKHCQSSLTKSKSAFDRAKKLRELDEFVATCNGDEVDVARREGIPSGIEGVGSGRVFVYPPKGKSKRKPKRFAFDANGKRTNEKKLLAPAPKKSSGEKSKKAPKKGGKKRKGKRSK